ncbi:amidase [Aspergillus tamarii]|uniref:Amidase n=1 Tax=Aspergillus tamarii TaxID=41984 RepID=A0A5N6VBC2_ASPTM|nr:amidase [Aspergillus tamarii]
MSWETVSKKAQADLLSSLPSKWRIDTEAFASETDVSQIPKTCGILSQRQIQITELTARQLARQIASRQLKALKVLEAFAARAAISHQLVNCLTAWFLEEGMQQAQRLDDILDSGGKPLGALHGVPVALKDSYNVKGHPTTRGYVVNKDDIQDHDSAIVATLRAAGAVFFCRTTMPQTGMALETVSNLWGRTLNPFNTKLVAGGSSGGDGALVAMRGCPIAPSSDIGGSIRIPAAFNGLYAIRPTSLRIPKAGWGGSKTGQISIRDSVGPVCHSVEDVQMFTEILTTDPANRYDVSAVPVPWRHVSLPKGKLVVGIMKWDGVVMPHPPVLRAMEHAKQVLGISGFEVIEFQPPFDCWELAKCTFDIYFQEAGEETLAKLRPTGEPLIPAFADLLKVYNARHLSALQLCHLNLKMREFKDQFANAWKHTSQITRSGHPMDALICPAAPSVGAPHDYNAYWGYTSMFNFLDYPSTILPLDNFKVDPQIDRLDPAYQPLNSNPYDKAYQAMYDAELFANQPSTIQIVGRPFDDEELIEVTAEIDSIFKATGQVRPKL